MMTLTQNGLSGWWSSRRGDDHCEDYWNRGWWSGWTREWRTTQAVGGSLAIYICRRHLDQAKAKQRPWSDLAYPAHNIFRASAGKKLSYAQVCPESCPLPFLWRFLKNAVPLRAVHGDQRAYIHCFWLLDILLPTSYVFPASLFLVHPLKTPIVHAFAQSLGPMQIYSSFIDNSSRPLKTSSLWRGANHMSL